MTEAIVGTQVCGSGCNDGRQGFIGPTDGACRFPWAIFSIDGPIAYLTSDQVQSLLDGKLLEWKRV